MSELERGVDGGSVPARVWAYLVVATLAAIVALAALPLALHARADRDRAGRLADDHLVLMSSVAEARALALQLRLSVAQAALAPRDPGPAQRFRSDRARLADELRRARLHTPDHDSADVIDDVENRTLAFGDAAERLFGSLAAGHADEARASLLALESDSGQLMELIDELTTVATTRADGQARGLTGDAHMWGLLALAMAALIVALHGATLAAVDSGAALAPLAGAMLPPSLRRHVPGRLRPRERSAGAKGIDAAGSTLVSTLPVLPLDEHQQAQQSRGRTGRDEPRAGTGVEGQPSPAPDAHLEPVDWPGTGAAREPDSETGFLDAAGAA